MAILKFEDYSFKYDSLSSPTLKHICLTIQKGEKVFIAGPSGSGKSTIAHCINGLIPCSYKGEIDGKLTIKDFEPINENLYTISEHVGTILQDQDCQFVGLTVGEDVAFAYENENKDQSFMESNVNKALKSVGMLEHINQTPHNLSGGQKQLVSLAGILSTDGDILLFDEPLANLDPVSRYRTMNLIDQIHKETNKTIIVVEHRIEDVLAYDFDRMIVMDQGKIVANDHPNHILLKNDLRNHGLREPLYVELLKKIEIKISDQDEIANIEKAIKFKEIIRGWYENKVIKPIKSLDKDVVLSLQNICFTYYKDEENLIKNVSFDIHKGEILAMLGNNGAGKSTILKLISGIKKPNNGIIELNNKRIDKWSIKKRSDYIGYVMQNPNHMISQNMIYDEIALGLRVRGYDEEEIKDIVEETLKTCGLYKYRKWPISALSYGQKKRVTIAAILALKPQLIILDEPTAGQDYDNYKEFMDFLMKIKNSGISMMMITHDLHLTLEYADRAVVLSDGEILADGDIYEILSNTDLMKRGNLRETTLSELAQICGIENKENFLRTCIDFFKEVAENE